MEDIARYETFTPHFDGEREVALFWIAGPLKGLERRAERENGPEGKKPNRIELLIAMTIGLAALMLVNTLL